MSRSPTADWPHEGISQVTAELEAAFDSLDRERQMLWADLPPEEELRALNEAAQWHLQRAAGLNARMTVVAQGTAGEK